jgi:hypothetical protein
MMKGGETHDMKWTYLFPAIFAAVALALVVGVEKADACPVAPKKPVPCVKDCPIPAANWTQLLVSQDQHVRSAQPVTLKQQVQGETSTQLGNQASSKSQHFGNQVIANVLGAGRQTQSLMSGARTTWTANMWPTLATAGTQGAVHQQQAAQSAVPMTGMQHAGTWQMGNAGASSVEVDGIAKQMSGAGVSNVQQLQGISGQSQAQGWINPPFPKEMTFNVGGVLRQFVGLTVENIINW